MQGEYEVDYQVRGKVNGEWVVMGVRVGGQGVNPALIFDRREVVIGVVPLRVVTRMTFAILNDGYENVSIDQWKL